MIWSLEQGLELVRLLQPETRKFGYHLTLGGGVLNKGSSDKDLDLFFLPLDNSQTDPKPDELLTFLRTLWGDEENFRPRGEAYTNEVDEYGIARLVVTPMPPYEQPESSPYKYKVKFMYGGNQRLDIFIIDIFRPRVEISTEQPQCALSS